MRFSLLNTTSMTPLRMAAGGVDGPLGGDPEGDDEEEQIDFGDLGTDDDEDEDDLNLGGDDDDDDDDDAAISLDGAGFLGKLFEDDPPARPNGNGGGGGNQDGPTPEEVQTALAEELNTGIESLGIPEDFLPEDFDPNDPKKLRQAFTNLQQRTARAAVGLAFKPMQIALTEITRQLRAEMRQVAQGAAGANTSRLLLEQEIPAAKNKKLRPIVDMVFAQAEKKFPNNPRGAIRATKKALVAMNIRSGSSSRGSTGNRRPGGGTGVSTLDLYAGGANRGTQTRTPKSANAGNRVLKALEALARQGNKGGQ